MIELIELDEVQELEDIGDYVDIQKIIMHQMLNSDMLDI
jgi:hypothetical protein